MLRLFFKNEFYKIIFMLAYLQNVEKHESITFRLEEQFEQYEKKVSHFNIFFQSFKKNLKIVIIPADYLLND